ncbi:MAG: hypothetical protein PWQ60_1517 [Thermoanaerobacteraceae bacterium]|jgi:predicted RNA binding protein YcfA (HicA-like mRNA interferase family)|nr:hypothetical protein [Thermoanaerobacteraceae bacterium]
MSPRLPRMTGKEVIKALSKKGFRLVHIHGSHHYLEGPKGNLVTVPVHAGDILKPKTLKSILKQAGITADDLIELH